MVRKSFSPIQTTLFIAALGGFGAACASTTSSVQSAGEHGAQPDGTTGPAGAQGSGSKTPPPPVPMKTVAGGITEETTLSSGMSACVSERRDLSRFHLSLELAQPASPEVLFVLKQWLLAAWTGNYEESVSMDECPAALLCAWIPKDSIEAALGEWEKLANSPPNPAFFAQLPASQRTAQEWDDTSPIWRLSTTSHFLLGSENTRGVGSVAESEQAWTLLVEKNSGSARVAQLVLSEMRSEASRLLKTSRLIVAGPSPSSEILGRLSPGNLGSPSAPSQHAQLSSEPDSGPLGDEPPLYPELVRLRHESDSSHGMLAWRPANDSHGDLEVALRIMVARWRAKRERGVQVNVKPAGGIAAWPVILVEGSYDAVEAALVDLKAEQDRFLSAAAAAQAEEYTRARTAIRADQTLGVEPRCRIQTGTASPDAPTEDPARVALRNAVGPVSVIWGTAELAVQSE